MYTPHHTHTHTPSHPQRGDKLVEYDGKSEKELTRDDIKAPDGWIWKTDWTVDSNRAVDEEGECVHVVRGRIGKIQDCCLLTSLLPSPFLLPSLPPPSLPPALSGWEYSVEAGLGAWVPYERNVHLCRRRRWVRLRKRDKDSKAVEKRKVSALSLPPPFLFLIFLSFPSLPSPHSLPAPHLPLYLLILTAQASEGIGGGLGVCPSG